jgi:hypothetical protein
MLGLPPIPKNIERLVSGLNENFVGVRLTNTRLDYPNKTDYVLCAENLSTILN